MPHRPSALLLIILVSCFTLPDVEAQPAHHLLVPSQQPVAVRVDTQHLTLATDEGQRLSASSPVLVWRPAGAQDWRVTRASELKVKVRTPGQITFQARFEAVEAELICRKTDNFHWEFSGTLVNSSRQPVELARFHYLEGEVTDGLNFLGMDGQLIVPADTLPAPRQATEKFWSDFRVFWPRLAEPYHDTPHWATSTDVAILTPSWNQPGWFFGFTGPGTAFGEIGYRTQQKPSGFYAGVLLDNVRLAPGDSRSLERLLVGYGDWQHNLRHWAKACAQVFEVPKPRAPLVGYCSWYQFENNVEATHVERAINEVAALPVPPGGRTVQIDDGFQRMPGDWRPNARFRAVWDSLPQQIAASGSVPGLWLAPTTILEDHPLAHQHPDWLQRLPNGQPAIHFANWGWTVDSTWKHGNPGKKTYYLETDRPEVKRWIGDIFTDIKAQGWRYLKIDFTYAVSTARVPYDSTKTRFETLRDLYTVFRESSGEDMLLNACIGEPGRYALGQVDIARLGGDMGSNWSSIRANLTTLFLRLHTNGVWWQADPDVFYMRQEDSDLTESENTLLTGTIGLMGGVFLTSDFPSQWSQDDQEVIKQFWNAQGPRVPAQHFMLFSDDGAPQAYRVSYDDGQLPQHAVGFYNWTDQVTNIRTSLAELGLQETVQWKTTRLISSSQVSLTNEEFVINQQPPHSLTLVGLSEE